MAGIMDTLLKGFGTTTGLKSYQHASKIFVDSNFYRHPKYSYLFYVMFDYNDSRDDGLYTPLSRGTQIGALCKSAALPKFTIDNAVLNAYNRPNIVQKKIKYDPVVLKFHDDSADIIREFWYDYMSFFYRDSDYETPVYYQPHKYDDRQKDVWGYSLRSEGQGFYRGNKDYRPLKAIRIYSFYAKKFSEYVLINPVITNFRHGEHSNESSNLLESEMTITYESVKYSKGFVSDSTFGDSMLLLYDRVPSSLTAGVTRSIFGQGGLIDTASSVLTDLSEGRAISALLKVNRAVQTFKGTNLGQVLKDEGLDAVQRAVLTGNNPLSNFNAPYVSGVASASGAVGLAVLAGGGLAALSSGSKVQPLAGPQITLAQSTSAVRDEATRAFDYRATSGSQLVSTPYRARQVTASFPRLTTAQVGSQVGIRNTVVSEFVEPAKVASLNINLNQASTVISGTTQGKQSTYVPTTKQFTSKDALTPDAIGYTYIFAKDELDMINETQPVDQVRKVVLEKQISRVMNSDAVNAELVDSPDLLRARDIYLKEFTNPNVGIAAYGSAEVWNAKKAQLLATFNNAFVSDQVNYKFQQFENIKNLANLAQNDPQKSSELARAFRDWLSDPNIISAFTDTVDIRLYLYDILNGTFSNNNTKKYIING